MRLSSGGKHSLRRQAMGEQFAFDLLEVKSAVNSESRPLLIENFRLEPELRRMDSVARLGGYSHYATFYAFQVGRAAGDWLQLEWILSDIARDLSQPGGTIWGASALASDGIVARGLSCSARDLPATLARLWNAARLFLTGEEAVPPRKLK